MIATALTDWEWCSGDYAAFDFRRDHLRLEVKQSACRQTWSTSRFSRPAWDIGSRTGFWVDGDKWVPGVGRNADVYVLALHSIIDTTADHRDPSQWQYYVIAESLLPTSKSIGLRAVNRLAKPVGLQSLADEVEKVVSEMGSAQGAEMEQGAV